MPLGKELEECLREFAAGGPAEVREAGARVAVLEALSWEVRGAPGSPLLHLWSEQYNLTRRILAISERSEERLVLAVQRFGRAKSDRLEFVRVEHGRSHRVVSREEFRDNLAQLLKQQFPDETVESLTVAPDLEHSLSGSYARGILRHGSTHWALLAVSGQEAPGTEENALTFALLWLERVRHSNHRGAVAGLRLILPQGASSAVVHRLSALDPRLVIDLYERNAEREILEKVDPRQAGNLHTWLVPVRDADGLLARAMPDLRAILDRAPAAITLHPLAESREVWLRFRGLAFARWEDGRIFYGAGDPRAERTPATERAFDKMLYDLEFHRHALASDTRHPFYRIQAERWLESLVRQDITAVDAALDPRFVYSQVFAASGADRGVIDLLSVTRTGRLAVLELKAKEHMHLPLQAAGYWLRVRRHQEEGEFARYGFFPGVELQQHPPLLYLVAPALRFHPSTDTLLRFLSPEIEVQRVGLAENWRHGLRVVMRQ